MCVDVRLRVVCVWDGDSRVGLGLGLGGGGERGQCRMAWRGGGCGGEEKARALGGGDGMGGRSRVDAADSDPARRLPGSSTCPPPAAGRRPCGRRQVPAARVAVVRACVRADLGGLVSRWVGGPRPQLPPPRCALRPPPPIGPLHIRPARDPAGRLQDQGVGQVLKGEGGGEGGAGGQCRGNAHRPRATRWAALPCTCFPLRDRPPGPGAWTGRTKPQPCNPATSAPAPVPPESP